MVKSNKWGTETQAFHRNDGSRGAVDDERLSEVRFREVFAGDHQRPELRRKPRQVLEPLDDESQRVAVKIATGNQTGTTRRREEEDESQQKHSEGNLQRGGKAGQSVTQQRIHSQAQEMRIVPQKHMEKIGMQKIGLV